MTVIDLSKLTQEQLWGLQFAVQRANQNLELSNKDIELQNKRNELNDLQNGTQTAPVPLKEPETIENLALRELGFRCDSLWQECLQAKKQMFESKFNAADPEVQGQVLELLGVPNVIEE